MKTAVVSSRRRGFTLIEVLVVITIAALLAAMVGVRWSGVLQRFQLDADINRITTFDSLLRNRSRADAIPVRVQLARDGDGLYSGSRRIDLAGSAITSVMIAGERPRRENASIGFRDDGSSDTYALEVSANGASTWLVFIGGSGQHWQTSNESEIDAIESSLKPRRNDSN